MASRLWDSSEPVDAASSGTSSGISGSAMRPVICVAPCTMSPSIIRTTDPSTTSSVVVLRTSVNSPSNTVTSMATGSIKVASGLPHAVRVTSSGSVIRPVLQSHPTKPLVVHPIIPTRLQTTDSNPQAPLKSEIVSTAPSTPPSATRSVIREMQVRVPNRRDRRFSVLRFHASDRPDLSSGVELFMQRENNLKQFRSLYNLTDAPERGAGSEFGRDAKEEARLRKHGVVRDKYRPDDQPWIMTVGKGKSGRRRFRGAREGSVSENVEYFVFCQCKDGNFDAYPIHAWYKMKPEINYRFLREDEAEIEYNRLHKTMNLFSVMIKRKLTDGEGEDNHQTASVNMNRDLGKELRYLSVATEGRGIADKESLSSLGDPKTGSRRSDRTLKLTDFEECISASDADEEEDDEGDEGEGEAGDEQNTDGTKPSSSKQKLGILSSVTTNRRGKVAQSPAERARLLRKKQRDAIKVSRMRRCVKKHRARKRVTAASSSDEDDPLDEACDESEIDDHEGDEVDYMTNSSSDEEKLSTEERDKIYEETGVDEETGLKALLTDISSEEEDEQENEERDEQSLATDADDTQEESSQGAVEFGRRRHDTNSDAVGGTGKSLDDLSSLLMCGRAAVTEENETKSRRNRARSLNRHGRDSPSSSSSSSSVDGDSSTYTSSSSSDSDLDPDEKVKKSIKKVALLQKLSHSVHANVIPSATFTDASDQVSTSAGIKRRATDTSITTDLPASDAHSPLPPLSKRSRVDAPTATVSGSTPATDNDLINTVRKYLMRKPITVTELLKKIRLRKLVGKNEDAQTALANVLRQLRPIKQIINGQHALSLKH